MTETARYTLPAAPRIDAGTIPACSWRDELAALTDELRRNRRERAELLEDLRTMRQRARETF